MHRHCPLHTLDILKICHHNLIFKAIIKITLPCTWLLQVHKSYSNRVQRKILTWRGQRNGVCKYSKNKNNAKDFKIGHFLTAWNHELRLNILKIDVSKKYVYWRNINTTLLAKLMFQMMLLTPFLEDLVCNDIFCNFTIIAIREIAFLERHNWF